MRSPYTSRLAGAGLAACLAMTLGACGTSRADKAGGAAHPGRVVLTFATNHGLMPDQIEGFIQQVEQLSGGDLRIDRITSWRQGEPEQEKGLIEDVQAGKVDMSWVGARAFDEVGVTSFQALVAPLLVDNHDLQGKIFEAGIPGRMLAPLNTIGLTGIGVLPGPMHKMTGVDHPFTKPADFAGEVVGTSGGALAEQALQHLGATPRRWPADSTLEGLDGSDNQLSTVYGLRLYRRARYLTANIDLWPRPLVIFMDAGRFAGLTPTQQEVLRTAAANSIGPALEATRVEEAEAGRGLCVAGMTLVEATDSDLAALNSAVEPVFARLEKDPATKSFLDEIRAIKARTSKPAESLTCRPGTASGGTAATPIDGVYQVTTTPADSPDDPRPVPENYGAWTYVFDRGRFAITQEDEEACTWGYGTYVVTGDRVTWSFTNGGGISPNNALNKPGERFVFGWSLYRDMLTLTPVPGEISPENFLVKPWHRTGEAPSLQVFGTRCPPPPDALPPVG